MIRRVRTRRSAEHRSKRERAQSLVEFCLILPVFLILVFGVIDFGMGLRAYITVAQATREGARFGAIGNPDGGSGTCVGQVNTTVRGKVCGAMGGLTLSQATVAVSYPSGKSPGNPVHVSSTYNYRYITPLRRLINFFSGGTLGSTISVRSSTDMRLE